MQGKSPSVPIVIIFFPKEKEVVHLSVGEIMGKKNPKPEQREENGFEL